MFTCYSHRSRRCLHVPYPQDQRAWCSWRRERERDRQNGCSRVVWIICHDVTMSAVCLLCASMSPVLFTVLELRRSGRSSDRPFATRPLPRSCCPCAFLFVSLCLFVSCVVCVCVRARASLASRDRLVWSYITSIQINYKRHMKYVRSLPPNLSPPLSSLPGS